MTEVVSPPSAPMPTDTTLPTEELVEQTTKMIADVVREVLDAEGVRWIKGEVKESYTEGNFRFIKIQRPENDAKDDKPYPVINVATKPQVGDQVHCLQVPGGVVVLGVDQKTTDVTVEDANNNANTRIKDANGTVSDANLATNYRKTADKIDGADLKDNSVSKAKLSFTPLTSGDNISKSQLPSGIIFTSDVKQDRDGYLIWAG